MQEALPEVHGGKKGVLTIMHSCMCFIRSHFSILSFTWATGLVRVCYSTKLYFSNIMQEQEWGHGDISYQCTVFQYNQNGNNVTYMAMAVGLNSNHANNHHPIYIMFLCHLYGCHDLQQSWHVSFTNGFNGLFSCLFREMQLSVINPNKDI